MIFPTLEVLTAGEQEIHERQQLAARGCFGPASPLARRYLNAPGSRTLEFMRPGVEYRACQVMDGADLKYHTLQRLVESGVIERTGYGKYKRPEVREKTLAAVEATLV